MRVVLEYRSPGALGEWVRPAQPLEEPFELTAHVYAMDVAVRLVRVD